MIDNAQVLMTCLSACSLFTDSPVPRALLNINFGPLDACHDLRYICRDVEITLCKVPGLTKEKFEPGLYVSRKGSQLVGQGFARQISGQYPLQMTAFDNCADISLWRRLETPVALSSFTIS